MAVEELEHVFTEDRPHQNTCDKENSDSKKPKDSFNMDKLEDFVYSDYSDFENQQTNRNKRKSKHNFNKQSNKKRSYGKNSPGTKSVYEETFSDFDDIDDEFHNYKDKISTEDNFHNQSYKDKSNSKHSLSSNSFNKEQFSDVEDENSKNNYSKASTHDFEKYSYKSKNKPDSGKRSPQKKKNYFNEGQLNDNEDVIADYLEERNIRTSDNFFKNQSYNSKLDSNRHVRKMKFKRNKSSDIENTDNEYPNDKNKRSSRRHYKGKYQAQMRESIEKPLSDNEGSEGEYPKHGYKKTSKWQPKRELSIKPFKRKQDGYNDKKKEEIINELFADEEYKTIHEESVQVVARKDWDTDVKEEKDKEEGVFPLIVRHINYTDTQSSTLCFSRDECVKEIKSLEKKDRENGLSDIRYK